MLALVAFTFQAGSAEGRLGFWKNFEENDPQKFRQVGSFDLERAIADEAQFKAGFASQLAGLINQDPEGLWKKKAKQGDAEKTGSVTVRLVSVQYTELKAILEILGNEEFRNFAIQVLAIYSPLAFQPALQTQALPSARPELLDGGA